MVENLPTNAGDTGSSPDLGRSHMPRSNKAREPQLLSLRVWSLCSATREAAIVRGLRTAMKSGPHLPQLEKALAQKRRPNTAKKIKIKLQNDFKKKRLKGPEKLIKIRRPPELRLKECRPCSTLILSETPPLNHCSKTLIKSSRVGTHSFSRQKPRVSPFAWQSNKAILFYFTQNSCLPDLIRHPCTERLISR